MDQNWPINDSKLNMSLSANHHGLTDQSFSMNQTYNIIDCQTLFTWLWRWLPFRLAKHQSPATVLSRTSHVPTPGHSQNTNYWTDTPLNLNLNFKPLNHYYAWHRDRERCNQTKKNVTFIYLIVLIVARNNSELFRTKQS